MFEKFDIVGMLQNVWMNGYQGVALHKLLLAIAIVLSFVVLRKLLAAILLWFLKPPVRKFWPEFADEILRLVSGPVQFLFIIFGFYFATITLKLEGNLQVVVLKLLQTMIVIFFFWMFLRLVKPVGRVLHRLDSVLSEAIVDWIVRAIRFGLIFLGTATVLEYWGIKVGPILAGFGLLSVAVALGAQDMFKNLISGILVTMERRFSVGDWIAVDGVVEGTVEKIGFRSTLIRRFDKAPVYVPNARLADNAVTNYSGMTHRRISWVIGITYSATVEQLRTIREQIESYLLNNEGIAQPPEVALFVRIDKFSDSSIDIILNCFTKTTVGPEYLLIKEELAYAIKAIVEGAGCDFAFPSQSVYIETMPETKPETFSPPDGNNG